MMETLKDLQVAVIATDGVEESELTEPVAALREAGATVAIISPHAGRLTAFRHHDKSATIDVDLTLDKASPGSYDALLLPGGALNADALRAEPSVLKFIQVIQEAGRPIAAICHAPWELISAGLVRGRTLTSYHTIQDDVRNAGGEWINRDVVIDRNWVSSRQPRDIPKFNQAMIKLIAESATKESGGRAAA
ncbi:MAG TPA: type 1 glutamine amidotransferase domain-containing protein [Terriglobia bacterium]|nr:type 1 glutamine amidotransferase domain-containing protein [Terriglobia bacterium]